jgi:hypothetical protein
VVVVSLVVKPMLATPDDMPFQTLLDLARKWFPAFALMIAGASLGMNQYLVHLMNRRLPELGMSERAVQRVRELGRSIAVVSVWRPLLGAYLFDKLVG